MKPLLTGVLIFALAACGGSGGTSGSPSAPATPGSSVPDELKPGADWVLVSGVDSADATTLRFDVGEVSGRAPVNSYFGPGQATADGGLQVGPLASTKRGGEAASMRAETKYLRVLESVDGWQIVDDRLELTKGEAGVLVFAGPDSTEAFARTLIGMPAKKAQAKAEAADFTVRVVSVDGQSRPATTDYRPDRINLTVVDGKVTQVSVN